MELSGLRLICNIDFYNAVFSRNSIDGNGMDIIGTVRFDDDDGETLGYFNAFWDGVDQFVYGEGDGELFGSFTEHLDVTGHEWTHAVTQFTADLPYMNQSGALNESISDVFGSMIKQFYAPDGPQKAEDADWLVADGIFLVPNAKALRDMENPGTAYDNPLIGPKDPQPASMDDYV
ncbi:Translation initiation factor 3 subunit b, partial [Mortierella alpina]